MFLLRYLADLYNNGLYKKTLWISGRYILRFKNHFFDIKLYGFF